MRCHAQPVEWRRFSSSSVICPVDYTCSKCRDDLVCGGLRNADDSKEIIVWGPQPENVPGGHLVDYFFIEHYHRMSHDLCGFLTSVRETYGLYRYTSKDSIDKHEKRLDEFQWSGDGKHLDELLARLIHVSGQDIWKYNSFSNRTTFEAEGSFRGRPFSLYNWRGSRTINIGAAHITNTNDPDKKAANDKWLNDLKETLVKELQSVDKPPAFKITCSYTDTVWQFTEPKKQQNKKKRVLPALTMELRSKHKKS